MKKQSGCWLIAAAVLLPVAAVAQDDDTPDLAFLEYLGSWEDSDEEWLVVAEQMTDEEDFDTAAAEAQSQAAARREDEDDDEQNSD